MTAPTYEQRIAELAKAIAAACEQLKSLEAGRAIWSQPNAMRLNMGHDYLYLVTNSGKVWPGLEGLQREALAYIDKRIASKKGEIEGLRFKLIALGREGGAR